MDYKSNEEDTNITQLECQLEETKKEAKEALDRMDMHLLHFLTEKIRKGQLVIEMHKKRQEAQLALQSLNLSLLNELTSQLHSLQQQIKDSDVEITANQQVFSIAQDILSLGRVGEERPIQMKEERSIQMKEERPIQMRDQVASSLIFEAEAAQRSFSRSGFLGDDGNTIYKKRRGNLFWNQELQGQTDDDASQANNSPFDGDRHDFKLQPLKKRFRDTGKDVTQSKGSDSYTAKADRNVKPKQSKKVPIRPAPCFFKGCSQKSSKFPSDKPLKPMPPKFGPYILRSCKAHIDKWSVAKEISRGHSVCEVCRGLNGKDMAAYVNSDGVRFRLCSHCAILQATQLLIQSDRPVPLKTNSFATESTSLKARPKNASKNPQRVPLVSRRKKGEQVESTEAPVWEQFKGVYVPNWITCNKCKQWRRLPTPVELSNSEWNRVMPDTQEDWYCHMNRWSEFNACAIPQELNDKQIDQEREEIRIIIKEMKGRRRTAEQTDDFAFGLKRNKGQTAVKMQNAVW